MKCYIVAASRGTSLDHYDNTWSLFHLVESVQWSEFPAHLPVHVLSGFEVAEDEIDQQFEIRAVLLEGEEVQWRGDGHEGRVTARRLRVRTRGIRISRPGTYHVAMEWRFPEGEDEWSLGSVRWPLTVEAVEEEGEEEDEEPGA